LSKWVIYILVLTILVSNLTLVSTVYSQETPTKVLVILAPGMNYTLYNELMGANVSFVREAEVIEINQYPPYTSLYYEYLVLSPNGYSLSNGIPLENYVMRWNGSKMDPVSIVNQSKIVDLWGDLDTVFINARIVSPENHSRTVNLEYKVDKAVIPLTVFEFKPDITEYWELLNTTIKVSIVNESYIFELANYGVSINLSESNPVSPVVTISVSENKTKYLEPGDYKLRFRMYVVNESKIVLLTLGTRNPSRAFSEFYHGYNNPITPHLGINETLVEKLPAEMIMWIVDEVSNFYVDLVNYVLNKYTGDFTYIYYPLFEEVYKLTRSIDNESLRNILIEKVYEGFNELVKKARIRMGEDDTIVFIISPYTIAQVDNGLDLEFIAPGIIGYNETVINDLLMNNYTYSIEVINGTMYVFITDERIGYGRGYIMIYPSLMDVEIKPLNARALEFYNIFMGSAGYGLRQLVKKIKELNNEITKLNNKINELNTTNTNLRSEIDNLKKQLGEANATVVDLKNQIASLKDQIDKLEKEREQIYMYLTMGIVTAILLSIVYILIIRSIARKK